MTFAIHASGAARVAIDETVPALVHDLVASRVTGGDAALWGPAAESEASIRLGWVEAVSVSRPLVAEIAALRADLQAKGCLLYTSPSPRDQRGSRMPSSA